MTDGPDAREAERVGLCARCRHGRRQASAKGSVFWRCQLARSDPRFRPYPPLPVRACPGFAPASPDSSSSRASGT